jgi:hypothetical protein
VRIERKCRVAALLPLLLALAAPAQAQTCPGAKDAIRDYTTIDNKRDPGVELYVFCAHQASIASEAASARDALEVPLMGARSRFGDAVWTGRARLLVCGGFGRAPVAQLDRASDFGSEGWGFDSLRARQSNQRVFYDCIGFRRRLTLPWPQPGPKPNRERPRSRQNSE